MNNKNRKVWIDCGSYMGLITRRFVLSDEYSDDFELYAFDIRCRMKGSILAYGVDFHQKAVWIEDGVIPVFLTSDSSMKGTSSGLYPSTKQLREGQKLEEVSMPCFDLSSWIMEKFSVNDYIILKLDIEGAEYKVLQKMFDDGSIDYINRLYVEFHSNKRKKIDFDAHEASWALHEKLSDIAGLELFVNEDIPNPIGV